MNASLMKAGYLAVLHEHDWPTVGSSSFYYCADIVVGHGANVAGEKGAAELLALERPQLVKLTQNAPLALVFHGPKMNGHVPEESMVEKK